MQKAETITLYLMDGNEKLRIKASIENWIGIGYRIPRNMLDRCSDRKDFKKASVYFLFGTSEEGQGIVYIGQALERNNGTGILARLKEHDADPSKAFWTDVFFFTTKDNSLGPTELNYLENKFYCMADSAKKYIVKNANRPNPGNLSEEKESSLDQFSEYSKLILDLLGYKVFDTDNGKIPLAPIPGKPEKTELDEKLDSNILIAGGNKSRKYVRNYLIKHGYISEPMSFTISKLNKDGSGRYWANPDLDFLKEDWILALNDNVNRKLYLFHIPPKSISRSDVKTRINKSKVEMDIEIIEDEKEFICSSPKINYTKWLVNTLNY